MDVDDLTTLPELSLKIILETIKNRFARNCIFTNVSEIVISVNPFQYLDTVLGEDLIRQFHLDKSQAEISAFPPHLYSLARAAFRGAVGAGPHPAKNQSVLISGESGAGKTEATKLCLRYFASMSATRGGKVPALDEKQSSPYVPEEDSLEHKLMNANPIMEALGNAKTLRNDNSSRFGKWISLQLNGKGMIVGGSITKYLLEESRVVNVGPGERNYHIFYQVCKKFGVEATNFRYLSSSCLESASVDDSQDYETVMDALRSIGMVHDDREMLCNTVWGILHLGELKFDKAGTDSVLVKDESSQQALKLAAKLLVGLDREEAFTKLLLNQVVHAGHETVITPRTEEQAKTTRDSIAKMLYARLFDYIVLRINGAVELAQTSGQKVATSIGILDIFGFESFEVNSFEQLCINYANEKLQLFFIDYLTTAELALYQSEGLDVAKMPHSFTNNQPCVDLLEKPNGVFSLIGDEVRSRTGNDMEFLSKLYREHAKHPCFEKPRMGGKGVFSVKHYAQLVEYSVHGFIDKNKSKVGEDVIAFFSQSQVQMVRSMVSLFDVQPAITPSPSSRRMTTQQRSDPSSSRTKHASLGHAFKAQLSDLVVSIEATKAHFIRCIKPNSGRNPQVLDEKMVERQLQTSGMVDAVTIRQLGYSDRLSYPLFLRRYAPLVGSYFAPRATKEEWKKVQDASDQDKVRTILQLLPISTFKHWQLGQSRVFYRLPVLTELEKSRERIRHNATIALQRRVKGVQARRDYDDLLLVWRDVVACVEEKRWGGMPDAVRTAREMGFSEIQLRKFLLEWQAAKELQQVVMNLVQALTFAAMPSLPPNKWFRDRVTGLENAADQVATRKLRPNEALSQLVAMTKALHELLSTLWTICTNQQMDASASPKRARETILSSCQDGTAKRNLLCAKLPTLLQQLEAGGTEVETLPLWHKAPIESFPEIQSLCDRIDALDQHFKESVIKLEASIKHTLGCDARTIESVLGVLTETELGIPLEYFPNGLEAVREPLVQKLALFQAENRLRAQAAEEKKRLDAAAAEAKAAAARLEPTPLPDHVLKPKLAGNRRKPQQVKSFPPAQTDDGDGKLPTGPADVPEVSNGALALDAETIGTASVVTTFVVGGPVDLPLRPTDVNASNSIFSVESRASISAMLFVPSMCAPVVNLPPPPTSPSMCAAVVNLPPPPTSPSMCAAAVDLPPPPASPAPVYHAAPISVPEISRSNSLSVSELEAKGDSDSEEGDNPRMLENPTGFSSLLPVFHGLGTRLNRSSLPGPGTLRVVVHSCANLIFFANNFFVSLTYCHTKKTDKGAIPRMKKKRTSVLKKGARVLNWDESLEFTSRDPSTDWLRIAVKEKESRSKSKCLGEVRFKVAEIALMAHQLLGNRVGNSQLHRVWQLRGSVQGEITLTFSFVENYWAKEKLKKAEKRTKIKR